MPSTQEQIDDAFQKFFTFDRGPVDGCPTPEWEFNVGDPVSYKWKRIATIADRAWNGKVYRLEFEDDSTVYDWWHNVHPTKGQDDNAAPTFADWLPGSLHSTTIKNLFMQLSDGGIVCDPRYQRGYVWTDDDCVTLIDSIFNRVPIGSVVFSTHEGFMYDDDDPSTVQYINLDGTSFTMLNREDYTMAIVDGQQRLTTIWRFMTDQFAYKGFKWSELAFKTQSEFSNTIVPTRGYRELDVPYADVLRMFIMVNQGVAQTGAHLDSVRDQLAQLTQTD